MPMPHHGTAMNVLVVLSPCQGRAVLGLYRSWQTYRIVTALTAEVGLSAKFSVDPRTNILHPPLSNLHILSSLPPPPIPRQSLSPTLIRAYLCPNNKFQQHIFHARIGVLQEVGNMLVLNH